MYKIYIIEDDGVIAEQMKRHIDSWGLFAVCARDFGRIIEEFVEIDPQLVLLDISLPRYNGFHFCAEIRKISKVPVIFISSASDNMSIVMAMNMGGDDFIAKPFDLNVLTAKIHALLRRAYDYQAPTPKLSAGGAELDSAGLCLYYNGGRTELTKNYCRILETLLKSKGRAVSRAELMEKLWETDNYIDENTLTVNIARLRKTLEDAGLYDFIKTKKGLGYMIEDTADVNEDTNNTEER